MLCEANAAGQKFEQKIARNIKRWLQASNLNSFKATHYQGKSSLKEDDGRDEDYSDIEIVNTESGDKFFVECKEKKANFVTTQFDINEDGTVTPVAGKSREELGDEASKRLAELVEENEQFQKFVEFLDIESPLLGDAKPSKFYFGHEDVSDAILSKLMEKYNKFLKSGKAEADCKPFDKKLVREKTRNMLACGLCWRLSDPSRTWDICTIKDIPFFSELVKSHYASKKIPAKYIQIDDDLFVLDASDNPLSLSCTELPKDLSGRFDLKFTPRFGTGSMYVTPRSKMLSKLESNASFKTRERWPTTSK